jgi:hypothetical protein
MCFWQVFEFMCGFRGAVPIGPSRKSLLGLYLVGPETGPTLGGFGHPEELEAGSGARDDVFWRGAVLPGLSLVKELVQRLGELFGVDCARGQFQAGAGRAQDFGGSIEGDQDTLAQAGFARSLLARPPGGGRGEVPQSVEALCHVEGYFVWA